MYDLIEQYMYVHFCQCIREWQVKAERRERRKREIMEVAYTLLSTSGFKATSMLSIAKQAGTSNGTLYAWFGSKEGLFAAMVEENASGAAQLLRASLQDDADLGVTLERFGHVLLRMVTGEKAILINRAAAEDAAKTGLIGKALAHAGRDAIVSLLTAILEKGRENGVLAFDDVGVVTETYIGLLIGDLQIRRAIGAISEPDDAAIVLRAERAKKYLLALFGTK
ncbi:TetR/AcrR family transcriptional regulator [Mesorhizobium sp. M9A.F.Ca.ET.002.03.1.2]|uniref:TetR/AcrR family transcriptional regulator n=1 Tax=Mesorhizobium sp. M9A.F.Ca.ET.002.03.1.2 TaxID=2493668 RepID=UPI000F750F8E|nr:TetR/AcrR family transcriptional regulator [Mesorhizobium sp. M9A.F.Ca.ET.002.03.1.2]AZN96538.1 TetR/AcrR family transcriptional regulator [Mesorhizobium sp. M9A.F.Ca.ET.002.03.1.2]